MRENCRLFNKIRSTQLVRRSQYVQEVTTKHFLYTKHTILFWFNCIYFILIFCFFFFALARVWIGTDVGGVTESVFSARRSREYCRLASKQAGTAQHSTVERSSRDAVVWQFRWRVPPFCKTRLCVRVSQRKVHFESVLAHQQFLLIKIEKTLKKTTYLKFWK